MPTKRPAEEHERVAATPAKKTSNDGIFEWNNKAYKICKKDEHVVKEIKVESARREQLLMERIGELERALAAKQCGVKTTHKEDKNTAKFENYWEATWPLSKVDEMGKAEAMSYLVLAQVAAEVVYDESITHLCAHRSNHSKLQAECAREENLLLAAEARRKQWWDFNRALKAKLKSVATLSEKTLVPEAKAESIVHKN